MGRSDRGDDRLKTTLNKKAGSVRSAFEDTPSTSHASGKRGRTVMIAEFTILIAFQLIALSGIYCYFAA